MTKNTIMQAVAKNTFGPESQSLLDVPLYVPKPRPSGLGLLTERRVVVDSPDDGASV